MLLITSQDWGGAQLFVFELARELKQQGEQVIVVAGSCLCSTSHVLRPTSEKRGTSGTSDAGRELSSRCLEADIPFLELKYVARDINPIANLLATFELIMLFRRLRPRVVHLNSTMMGVVGSLAATLARVPKRIYCIGGWVFNEDLPSWKKKLYILIERISAKWKDVIVTVHPGDEELANSLKIKAKDKIVTIPNGVNVDEFEANLLTREQAREKLGIHPQAVIVGTIANAYPPKNLLWYLDVCKAVHDRDPRINFVIIGDGPQFEALQKKRDELDAHNYIMLTGRRMDAPTLYEAFDMFVLPSSKEGMSITLLEAMVAKVPIVATDVGAAKWMLADNAEIVAPNNNAALSEAIIKLVANEDQKDDLANRAHKTVLERFSLTETLVKHIQTITDR